MLTLQIWLIKLLDSKEMEFFATLNEWGKGIFIVQSPEAKHYVDVILEIDELEVTSVESKVTYEEISIKG